MPKNYLEYKCVHKAISRPENAEIKEKISTEIIEYLSSRGGYLNMIAALKKLALCGINFHDYCSIAKAHVSFRVLRFKLGDFEMFWQPRTMMPTVLQENIKPSQLVFKNGVYDLEEKRFLHAKIGEGVRTMGCCYNPVARIGTEHHWYKFLQKTFGGNQETIDYLRLAFVSCLTKKQFEVFFYLYGPPNSGKGVILETLLAVFGTYAETDKGYLTLSSGSRKDIELISQKLDDAHVYVEEEIGINNELYVEHLCAITGGGNIRVTPRGEVPEVAKFTAKIWCQGNYLPTFEEQDQSIWRRAVVIPTPNSVSREEIIEFSRRHRGKTIKEIIVSQELAAIANWMIAWYRKLNRQSLLSLPENVKEATTEWRSKVNPLWELCSILIKLYPNVKRNIDGSYTFERSQAVKALAIYEEQTGTETLHDLYLSRLAEIISRQNLVKKGRKQNWVNLKDPYKI